MSDLDGYFTTKARVAAAGGLSIVPLLEYPFSLVILTLATLVAAITLIDVDESERTRLVSIYAGISVATWILMWLIPSFFWDLLIWICGFVVSSVLLYVGPSAR